ncbi:hypothetical protein Zmor_006207 [Zophobas morio]|uniref:Uncharacterized protein n=1 Tax=Zophobas morio TaxID=2755281 RepID=A0AA38ITC9_9CUCU|nr:hypothetical protein Zmor_006207 [Zophobas morio]
MMYKIIPAQLVRVFSTLAKLDLLSEFSSRFLDYTNCSRRWFPFKQHAYVTVSRLLWSTHSRLPLPGSSPVAATDNESSATYMLRTHRRRSGAAYGFIS